MVGAASEFVICSENGCTMQVCMGATDCECYTHIDPSPLASLVWLCMERQHKTVLNMRNFFFPATIRLTMISSINAIDN